jgi:hypothetical protein
VLLSFLAMHSYRFTASILSVAPTAMHSIRFTTLVLCVVQCGTRQCSLLKLQMHNDQNILDVVAAVSRDLRHTASFRQLLHPLDEETSRRVAKAYIEFLYRTLEIERNDAS